MYLQLEEIPKFVKPVIFLWLHQVGHGSGLARRTGYERCLCTQKENYEKQFN
jgi:hypothetical protein